MAAASRESLSTRPSPDVGRTPNPATPIHSPHHSQHSSTSARTPLHTLSLHEYRKLQNDSASQSATPAGRTLRRKAAASALNGLERAPSFEQSSASIFRSSSSRPPHPSQPSSRLPGWQTLPPSPPHFVEQQYLGDDSFRPQSTASAHVRGPTESLSVSLEGGSQEFFTQKVSQWKPIKRLPKPGPARPGAHRSPISPSAVTPFSPARPATYHSSYENVCESGTQSTPSTFSLSKFPQPPHPDDRLLSRQTLDDVSPHLSTSFTTAPVTPPATPAVIHYRGTSFDLVNPHDSLLFHDIETPSKDFDSTDFLPLQSAERPLLHSEMTPRRPLYGDLSSAYNSIRKLDEAPLSPTDDRIMPPEPAAFTSASSHYQFPEEGYDTTPTIPTVAIKKDPNESRFSLTQMNPIRQLTRSFTKKLNKSPQPGEGWELKDFSNASPTTAQFRGKYPRPLDQSYPTSPARSGQPYNMSNDFDELEEDHISHDPRSDDKMPSSRQTYSTATLSSMIPDDFPGHPNHTDAHRSVSTGDMLSKPYYEEVESLYQSSSIYTGDDGEINRGHPSSIYSRRLSKPYDSFGFGEGDSQISPYDRSSIYSFVEASGENQRQNTRLSNHYSRPLVLQDNRRSQQHLRNEKTDTISKFIDQYGHQEGALRSADWLHRGKPRLEVPRGISGFSQFDFDLQDVNPQPVPMPTVQEEHTTQPAIAQTSGSPPHSLAPLAPAFVYHKLPNKQQQNSSSELFSGITTYSDTRHLLQIDEPSAAAVALSNSAHLLSGPSSPPALEPSSSYSQIQGRSDGTAPLEALEQAEQIFEQVDPPPNGPINHTVGILDEKASLPSNNIPAIWTRRGSGNLLRHRMSIGDENVDEEVGEWETVKGRASMDIYDDSIADYSSTEGSTDSQRYHQPISLPNLASGQSEASISRHPSPTAAQKHPFSSLSSSSISVQPSVTIGKTRHQTSMESSSSLPYPATVPHFQSRKRGYDNEPYIFMPGASLGAVPSPTLYELSDKETQDMLSSGPNDEILYDQDPRRRTILYPAANTTSTLDNSTRAQQLVVSTSLPFSPLHSGYNSIADGALERENTFEKLSGLGPKGNLTGTPQGTGMHEAGSSIADTSSPGAHWSSSPKGRQHMVRFPGFYTDPEQTSSWNPIPAGRQRLTPSFPELVHERTPSQETLFPQQFGSNNARDQPYSSSGRPQSLQSIRTTGSRSRFRPAVAGQTKLREMILACDAQTVSSGHSTHFSQFINSVGSGRPSSSNTRAPLRPSDSRTSQLAVRKPLASQHSPHLLLPERSLSPEYEVERKKLSWALFAIFLFPLPPMMILYPWCADAIITWMSKGKFGSCSRFPKSISIPTGIFVNIAVIAAIVILVVLKL